MFANILLSLILFALSTFVVIIAFRGFLLFCRHVSIAMDYRRANKIINQQSSSGSPTLDEAIRNLHNKGFLNYASHLARFARMRGHYPPSRSLEDPSTPSSKASCYKQTGILLDNLCHEIIRHFDGIVAVENEIERQDDETLLKLLYADREAIIEHLNQAYIRTSKLERKIRSHGDQPPNHNNHTLENLLASLNDEAATHCNALNRLQKFGLIPPKDPTPN